MAEGAFKRGLRLAHIALGAKKLNTMDGKDERAIARRALANQFADARGTIMKVGQLLAASDTGEHFDPLLKGIPAVCLASMTPVIEQALEQPIVSVFKSIDESTAAASLGQVHHAVLLNDEEVAVKIQYPDIADSVLSEVKLLGLMPGVGPIKKWGFDLGSYKNTFKNNMDRELDYQTEAASQLRFGVQVDVAGLKVPIIHTEYTRANLLIQSWEQGDYIDDISHWPNPDRKRIGEILLGTLFKSLFEAGIVHGDPHLGNSYFRYDENQQPQVVLMDYGCTIEVNEIQRLSLLKLILSTIEDLDTSPLRYFSSLGFDAAKLAKIGDTLPMLCRILFKPFAEIGRFPLAKWQLDSSFNQLLGERRWWFRSAGPSELFLIMRAFQGTVQQLQILKASVSWSQILRQSVSTETMNKARNLVLPRIAQEDLIATNSISALANRLRVAVKTNEQQTVNVALPAEMALDLKTLVPEDVLSQLEKNQTIDLDQIQQSIIDSGIAPQCVFNFEEGEKEYSVWLE